VAENLPALGDEQRQEARTYRERLDSMAGFLTSINALLNMLLDSGKGGFGLMQRTLVKTVK
jgi:hypothetical protein